MIDILKLIFVMPFLLLIAGIAIIVPFMIIALLMLAVFSPIILIVWLLV